MENGFSGIRVFPMAVFQKPKQRGMGFGDAYSGLPEGFSTEVEYLE
jgi:hypothetical protein